MGKPKPKSALRPRYLKVHAFLVFAFLFLPIAVLVTFSFNKARSGTSWTGFSTRWYRDLIHNEEVLQDFRNTLKVAIVSTIVPARPRWGRISVNGSTPRIETQMMYLLPRRSPSGPPACRRGGISRRGWRC